MRQKLPRFRSNVSANKQMRKLIRIYQKKITRTYLRDRETFDDSDDSTSEYLVGTQKESVLERRNENEVDNNLAPAIILAANSSWSRQYHYDDRYSNNGRLNTYDVLHSGDRGGEHKILEEGDPNIEDDGKQIYDDGAGNIYDERHFHNNNVNFHDNGRLYEDGDGEFHGGDEQIYDNGD